MSRLFQKYVSYCQRVENDTRDVPMNYLYAAICRMQYGQYKLARKLFTKATLKFVEQPKLWQGAGEPNQMVDSYILADQRHLFPLVDGILSQYRSHERSWTHWSQYAFAVWHLVRNEDETALEFLDAMLTEKNKREFKIMYAMGMTVQAVAERSQEKFDLALAELIETHSRAEKWGWYRDTPEGFVCLPGLSLSKLAMERDLHVNIESEYLPMRYLEYLFQHKNEKVEIEDDRPTLWQRWFRRK